LQPQFNLHGRRLPDDFTIKIDLLLHTLAVTDVMQHIIIPQKKIAMIIKNPGINLRHFPAGFHLRGAGFFSRTAKKQYLIDAMDMTLFFFN